MPITPDEGGPFFGNGVAGEVPGIQPGNAGHEGGGSGAQSSVTAVPGREPEQRSSRGGDKVHDNTEAVVVAPNSGKRVVAKRREHGGAAETAPRIASTNAVLPFSRIPIRAPFPDIASQVEKPLFVRLEAHHGCRRGEAVVIALQPLFAVLGDIGMAALIVEITGTFGRWPASTPRKGIRHLVNTGGCGVVRPFLFPPDPDRDAPLAIRGKTACLAILFAKPFTELLRILPTNGDYRMVFIPRLFFLGLLFCRQGEGEVSHSRLHGRRIGRQSRRCDGRG